MRENWESDITEASKIYDWEHLMQQGKRINAKAEKNFLSCKE